MYTEDLSKIENCITDSYISDGETKSDQYESDIDDIDAAINSTNDSIDTLENLQAILNESGNEPMSTIESRVARITHDDIMKTLGIAGATISVESMGERSYWVATLEQEKAGIIRRMIIAVKALFANIINFIKNLFSNKEIIDSKIDKVIDDINNKPSKHQSDDDKSPYPFSDSQHLKDAITGCNYICATIIEANEVISKFAKTYTYARIQQYVKDDDEWSEKRGHKPETLEDLKKTYYDNTVGSFDQFFNKIKQSTYSHNRKVDFDFDSDGSYSFNISSGEDILGTNVSGDDLSVMAEELKSLSSRFDEAKRAIDKSLTTLADVLEKDLRSVDDSSDPRAEKITRILVAYIRGVTNVVNVKLFKFVFSNIKDATKYLEASVK